MENYIKIENKKLKTKLENTGDRNLKMDELKTEINNKKNS
jgi:hypothetical protein